MDEQRFLGLMEQMIRSIVTEKLQEFEARMEAGLRDVRSDIAALSARVDLIKESVDSLEESMTDVKKILTYLQDKWVEHDREIWQLKRKA